MSFTWKLKIPIRFPDDRRQADRVYIETSVVCKIGASELKTNCEDISVNGLRIRSPRPLSSGTSVQIELENPFSHKKIHLLSEVVWSKECGRDFLVGLKHLKVLSEDASDFYEFLTQAMLNFLFCIADDEGNVCSS